MSRAGLLVAALAFAALLAAAAVALFLLLLDNPTPARVDEAVTTFRDQESTGDSPVPEGVYVYATDGYERTDALTGVTHRYPARSTITVTGHECGVRMRWDVLDGRSTTWTFCVSQSGWSLESQDERHTFFGRTERTTYLCSDTLFRPAGDRVGVVFPVRCETESVEERGRGRVVARGATRVGGRDVASVHLRRRTTFSGETRGSATHDVWLDRETGVPVQARMVSRTTNTSPIGDVTYEEEVSLRLTSLTPRR